MQEIINLLTRAFTLIKQSFEQIKDLKERVDRLEQK